MLPDFARLVLLFPLLLPLAAAAQNSHQDSLLRRGELVGARPAAAPRPAGGRTAPFPDPGPADPVLARLLHEGVNVDRVPAAQLPDLYGRILEAVRAERRQWTPQQWQAFSATLSRLNARYEAVRGQLPLDERLQVRGVQGELRAMENARKLKDKIN